MSSRRLVFAGLAAFLFVSTSVREAVADLPPPAGVKRVGFSFSVKGLAAAPDRVLFAYPCGGSNGAPIREYQKLEEGASVSVGRRGGGCTLYSIAKPAYETWLKEYKPTHEMQDSALETLANQAIKCTGAPTPRFEIPSSDLRNSLTQTLTVKTLDATTCVLAVEPIATDSSQTSSSSGSSSPAKSSSCSLARGTQANGLAYGLALACITGTLAARRRRKVRYGSDRLH